MTSEKPPFLGSARRGSDYPNLPYVRTVHIYLEVWFSIPFAYLSLPLLVRSVQLHPIHLQPPYPPTHRPAAQCSVKLRALSPHPLPPHTSLPPRYSLPPNPHTHATAAPAANPPSTSICIAPNRHLARLLSPTILTLAYPKPSRQAAVRATLSQKAGVMLLSLSFSVVLWLGEGVLEVFLEGDEGDERKI